MNILICTVQVPFTFGGGEMHVENLKQAFIKEGFEAEITAIPFKWYPPQEIMQSALGWRILDLTEANGKPIDMVIGMRFPAYLVSHPNKVIWMMHQHRAVYELWDTPYNDLQNHPEGEYVRSFIKNADEKFIPEAKKVFANSKTVADRLKRFNNIDSEPLYHPPPRADVLYSAEQGDYVFYPSRMELPKRQELLIEATSYLKSPLRIIFSGNSPYPERYLSLVKKFKVADRVQMLGFVEEKKIIELYANALAICYLPFDEDYGYVTLEAMYAEKPVIVTQDSGGARELIEDGKQGLIVEPEPKAIANALDQLYYDKQKAKQLGRSGREKILSLNLSWQNVVEKLVTAGQPEFKFHYSNSADHGKKKADDYHSLSKEDKILAVIREVCPDLVVKNGCFAGMKYAEPEAVGSSLFPKLIGSYEKELEKVIEKIIENNYTEIINIGCAEGYYAIGLAKRMPNVKVFAFDIDQRALYLCRKMAELNGVAERVLTDNFCNPATLQKIPLTDKALIISDCEGFEKEFFTSKTAKLLKNHDLLIETHDFLDISISGNLQQLFEPTHFITVIESIDDIKKAKSYNYPELEKYDLPTKKELLAEHRPTIMEWLFMQSKQYLENQMPC